MKLFSAQFCLGPLVAILVLLAAAPARAADDLDEFTRAVASYELTMPNLEAYGATLASLAEWAAAQPAKAAQMRARLRKGPATYPQSIAHVESVPVVAEQLKKNKLTGRDFVVLPMVVMQGQIAALGEAKGLTFPADRINPKNTALVRAHEKRVGEIMAKVTADHIRAFGQ